jgi:hypothetical protein
VISRNPYLRNEEFSGDINLMSPGWGTQNNRGFNEDRIME